MKNETKSKLKAVFDKYDNKKAKIKTAADKKKSEHEIFLEEFNKKCEEVIRPAMEEVGEAIKERGHNYKIDQKSESIDRDGRTGNASMIMEIYPNKTKPDYINYNFPHLSFVAGSDENKVWTHISTMMPNRGGQAHKNNDYNLGDITKEVVEQEIVNLVTKCFSQ